MLFFRDLSNLSRGARALALVAASALLASCGGGDQEETFKADRIITVGDENSLITANGYQYTVNYTGVAATNPSGRPCIGAPVWVQRVAAMYERHFGECTGEGPQSDALMRATPGATVDSTAAAIDAINASGAPLRDGDLVTLAVGTHDVLNLFPKDAGGAPVLPISNAQADAMVSQAAAAGQRLGSLVVRIVARDAKVIFATIPDVGDAPVAAEYPGHSDLLTRMSNAFNNGISATASVPNGGGRNGAVFTIGDLVEQYRRNEGNIYSSVGDRVNAACVDGQGKPVADAALLTCVAAVTTDAKISNLWAGRVQYGLTTHSLLGQQAEAVLRANPL